MYNRLVIDEQKLTLNDHDDIHDIRYPRSDYTQQPRNDHDTNVNSIAGPGRVADDGDDTGTAGTGNTTVIDAMNMNMNVSDQNSYIFIAFIKDKCNCVWQCLSIVWRHISDACAFICTCSNNINTSLLKQVWKNKSIYLACIIHFGDRITDYLVLIQYGIFAWYHYYFDHIEYHIVFGVSIFIILINKVVSCIYIWRFTYNRISALLNFLDLYIFTEVLASHKVGNQTDLFRFMQKLEKLLESAPQFMTQAYVLLRDTADFGSNSDTNQVYARAMYYLNYGSIFLSFYAIASKLVSDDKTFFIEASGANKAWKPTSQWMYRVLFRVFEVMTNLLTIVIMFAFFGAFVSFAFLSFHISLYYILYRNGLLGNELVNILGYIVAVVNLGVTPTAKQAKKNILSSFFSGNCVFSFLFGT